MKTPCFPIRTTSALRFGSNRSHPRRASVAWAAAGLAVAAAALWAPASLLAQSGYTVEQVTSGNANHRAPSINNNGEVVWMQDTAQGWQVFSSTRGQLTFPTGAYTEAQYPTLADDGSYVCFRPGSLPCTGSGYLLRYPGETAVQTCTRNVTTGGHRDTVPATGISSDGTKVISGYEFFISAYTLQTRKFFVNGTQASPGTVVSWSNPSINNFGEYVYADLSQIFSSRRGAIVPAALGTPSDPAINNYAEVAYVSQGEIRVLCRSGDVGIIAGSGTSPALNDKGVVVFQQQINGYDQIFKATPPSCNVCVNWRSQCDARWKSDLYDGLPKSICAKGCAMTSLAMCLSYAGYPTDPGQLNSFMKINGCFIPGGNVNLIRTVDKFTGLGAKWRDTRLATWAGSNPAATSYLTQLICDRKYPVIVGVWKRAVLPRTQYPDHYVLVIGKSGNQFLIADPSGNPKTTLSDYPEFETRGYVEPVRNVPALRSEKDGDTVTPQVTRLSIVSWGSASVWLANSSGKISGALRGSSNVSEEIPGSTVFSDAISDDETDEPAESVTQSILVTGPNAGKYWLYAAANSTGAFGLSVESRYDDGSVGVTLEVDGVLAANATNAYFLPVGTSLGISRIEAERFNLDLVSDRTNRFGIYATSTLTNWAGIGTATLTNCSSTTVVTNVGGRQFFKAVSIP